MSDINDSIQILSWLKNTLHQWDEEHKNKGSCGCHFAKNYQNALKFLILEYTLSTLSALSNKPQHSINLRITSHLLQLHTVSHYLYFHTCTKLEKLGCDYFHMWDILRKRLCVVQMRTLLQQSLKEEKHVTPTHQW